MAKRTQSATGTTRARKSVPTKKTSEEVSEPTGSTSSRSSSRTSGEQMGFFKELIANPAVKYVAGGIASAMLTKFVDKLAVRYPEISRLLSENLDGIESRLSDFRNGQSSSQESVASTH